MFICPFSVDHCIVCHSSICGFRLPLWYLQAFLFNVFIPVKCKVMNLTLENYNKFVDSNNRPKQNNNKPKQNKLTNKNGPNQ